MVLHYANSNYYMSIPFYYFVTAYIPWNAETLFLNVKLKVDKVSGIFIYVKEKTGCKHFCRSKFCQFLDDLPLVPSLFHYLKSQCFLMFRLVLAPALQFSSHPP